MTDSQAASPTHNQFVEAVLADDSARADALGREVVRLYFEEGEQSDIEEHAQGIVLERDLNQLGDPDNPIDGLGIELLADVVKSTRYQALSDGAELTPRELRTWERLAAERLLKDWQELELDHDTFNTWTVLVVTHADSRVAYIGAVGGGYSWSGAFLRFVCAGASAKAVKAGLKVLGYLEVKDLGA